MTVSLSDVAAVNPSTDMPHIDLTDVVSFLPMAAVGTDGSVEFRSRPLAEVSSGYTTFAEGDVLLAKITPCFENGKAAFLRSIPTRIGFGSTEFHVIRPSKRIDGRYLYRLLTADAFRAAGSANMTGSAGQKRVPAEFLKRFQISLPPLPEQRRIATILDHVDALRAKRRAAITKLDSLAQSIFHEVVTSGGKSAEWPLIAIGDAGRIQLGRQRAPKYQTGKYTRKYVRVANIFEDRLDLSDVLEMDFDEQDFLRYRLEFGDILLNEGQSTELVGRPAMWRCEIPDCCFQNTLIRFQPDQSQLLGEFALALFLYYFRTGEFAKISSKTSSVAHLGASRFAKMLIPMPPLGVQQLVVERLSSVRENRALASRHLDSIGSLSQELQVAAFQVA